MDIRARDVAVREDELTVSLMDGRTITAPLAWYPRLAAGTPEQRARWEMAGGGYGIRWSELDEDSSTVGLLAGSGRRLGRIINSTAAKIVITTFPFRVRLTRKSII